MKNKIIYNKEVDKIEIDLIGEFNDGFWGNEISKEKVINILNENPKSEILVNLSSLGGSVDVALAARDWVLKHKAFTTVRLLGRNASASTVFSTAFDKVEISKSGMFLIHNVWGMAVGEAEELRQIADDFDKHNEVIMNIYNKKTGKSIDEIKDLMNANKWITAQEAQEFGFVDNIFSPTGEQDKMNLIKYSIYNKYLPHINNSNTNTKINNTMDNSENKVVEKNLTTDDRTFIEKLFNKKKTEVKDISEDTKLKFETEISNLKIEAETFNSKIAKIEILNAEWKTQNENLATEKSELNKEIETLKNQVATEKSNIEKLNSELVKTAAASSDVKNDEDELNKDIEKNLTANEIESQRVAEQFSKI